ncbi:hypothetical protein BGZ60DRAFT_523925 [Tricladium varicosporioides]|nr:hypothetical protein BGZ60DRAFT_523925 [Hymenoscyphus varicosporioides]
MTGPSPPCDARFSSNRGFFRNGIGRGISIGRGEPVNNSSGLINDLEGSTDNGDFPNNQGLRDGGCMSYSTTLGRNIPATDFRQENATTPKDNTPITISNSMSASGVVPNPSESAETSDSSTVAQDEGRQAIVNETDDSENRLQNSRSDINELDVAVLQRQLSQARNEIIKLAKELKDYIRWKDICKEHGEELEWKTNEMEHLKIRIVEERNARQSADNSIKTLLKNNIEAQTFNILRLQRDAALDARDRFMKESERLAWKHENLILETRDIRESYKQCMRVRAELVKKYPEVTTLFNSHDHNEHKDHDPGSPLNNALSRYGDITYPRNTNFGEGPSSRSPLLSTWTN